jgi:hypothetical protein
MWAYAFVLEISTVANRPKVIYYFTFCFIEQI